MVAHHQPQDATIIVDVNAPLYQTFISDFSFHFLHDERRGLVIVEPLNDGVAGTLKTLFIIAELSDPPNLPYGPAAVDVKRMRAPGTQRDSQARRFITRFHLKLISTFL
ncbi:MAG: hypothetical protein ACKPKO_18390 [Candidatus Fonsibacter sp.]